jgi:hypothetical protein
MTAMLLLLSMGLLVKTTKSIQRFLSDFKIWNQKLHAKDWLIFPENLGKRLSLRETSFNGTLYYFDQQSSKRKKRKQ